MNRLISPLALYLTTLFVATLTLQAQYVIDWQHSYGGQEYDGSEALLPDPNGDGVHLGMNHNLGSNSVMIGSGWGSYTFTVTNNEMWLLHLDDNGQELSNFTITGPEIAIGVSTAELDDMTFSATGNYVLASNRMIGQDQSGGGYNYRGWILEVDNDGQIIQSVTDSDLPGPYTRIITNSQSQYLASHTYRTGPVVHTEINVYNSNLSSGYSYGYWEEDFYVDICDLGNGNYATIREYWQVDIHKNGLVESFQLPPGYWNNSPVSFLPMGNGDFIIAAENYTTGSHLVRVDSLGNVIWDKLEPNVEFKKMIETPDGNLIIVGHHGSNGTDAYVGKFDLKGNKLYDQIFGGSSADYFTQACFGADGSLYVAGRSGSTDGDLISNQGFYDAWVLKLEEDPSFVPACTADPTICPDGITAGNHQIQITAFLEGAMRQNNRMGTELRDLGLLPSLHPYSAAPWNLATGPSINQSDIPMNAVDYVIIEARAGTPADSGIPQTVLVESQLGFLLSDSRIISTTGCCSMAFENLQNGEEYYFVLRHRNHLDVMTSVPIIAGHDMSYHFNSANAAYGIEQLKSYNWQLHTLHAADFNVDGTIQNTDFDEWIIEPSAVNMYRETDANLDGVIQNTDYDLWFLNKAKLGHNEIQY